MTEREFVDKALTLLFKQLVLLAEYSEEIRATKKEPEHNRKLSQTMLSIVLYAADELPKIAQGDTSKGSD